jgi:hypothetical protein
MHAHVSKCKKDKKEFFFKGRRARCDNKVESIIPEFGRQRKEVCEFQASLEYTVSKTEKK